MNTKSFSTPAIVLKRKNLSETDRLVTLLTRQQGKLVCIAKGARQMKSTKRAYLEPGNYIVALFINTKSLPLLTQAKLIDDFAQSKKELKSIRQLTQVLEIVDRLFAEGEEDEQLFDEVLAIIKLINLSPAMPASRQESERTPSSAVAKAEKNVVSEVKKRLQSLVAKLGYPTVNGSLLDQVAQLSDRPMRSWEYLRV